MRFPPERRTSLTFRLEHPVQARTPSPQTDPSTAELPRIAWHAATSIGLPYAGYLRDGTQLPVEGSDWVTWNPNTDSRPNLPGRLYGHEHTIRTIIKVLARYREAHPKAPQVVVGDISLRDGGVMDQHVSHENGLDVDIYYPRSDGWLQAPTSTAQIDRRLSQELLDGFVAAGASKIFVGYATDLRGPRDIVTPLSEPREPHARPLPKSWLTLDEPLEANCGTCRRFDRPSEAPSTFVAMSSGRPPTRLFAPEDDWFVETGGGRSPADDDETELRETRQSAQGEGEPRAAIRVREGERSRRLIVGAIVGAMILIVAGALAGALVSRSLNGGVETTTSLVTTTATLTTTLTTSTTPSTTPTTTTSSTPTTPATLPEGVVLRRGAKGVEVRQVQEALVALGYSTTIDGKFGPATAQAVKSFQASSGLTDDGVVGPATLSALSAAVNGT